MKKIDITGKKFGRLTAVKYVKKKGRSYYWLFRCECGKEKICFRQSVTCGQTRSCGCYVKDFPQNKKHGACKTRFYKIWKEIKYRCSDRKNKTYGGRGIKCLWPSFEEFRYDMYESYIKHKNLVGEGNTTIDRINSHGNYSKENCRWATQKIQQRNRRNNHTLSFGGKRKCIAEWAEIIGLSQFTLHSRIKFGWSTKDILTKPVK